MGQQQVRTGEGLLSGSESRLAQGPALKLVHVLGKSLCLFGAQSPLLEKWSWD